MEKEKPHSRDIMWANSFIRDNLQLTHLKHKPGCAYYQYTAEIDKCDCDYNELVKAVEILRYGETTNP